MKLAGKLREMTLPNGRVTWDRFSLGSVRQDEGAEQHDGFRSLTVALAGYRIEPAPAHECDDGGR